MKKPRRFAFRLLPLLLIACFSGSLTAAPYGPKGHEIRWVQPSGEKLNLRVFGDDYYGRTETEDGYTVVYNSKDGAYHYAELSADGKTLKPSGIKAHRPARDGQVKHADLPVEQIRKIYQTNRTRLAGKRNQVWAERVQAAKLLRTARAEGRMLPGPEAAAASIKAAPVAGKKIGLTILVQFPNDPKTTGSDPVTFPVDRSKIVRFCNKEGYNEDGNTGSVRDYFYDQSIGKVTYTQTVTEIVTLDKPRNYYNYSNYPTNTTLRDTGEAGRMLISEAVEILKTQNFDFSNLTVDTNNNAIATNMFFAGPDSGVWAEGLWPHQWSLASGLNVGTTTNPIYLYNYQVTNIENSQPVIGTFCHENGHLLLDYPDLYDIFGEGVGEHCLMGSGNYLNGGKTPCTINAFFKDMVGWANITELTTANYITKNLPTTGNIAYRIRKPGLPTESFVVENRGKGDKWAQYADDKGIAIWHVDETVSGNIGNSPYMVSLEQADDRMDLERGINRGDSTDLFDLTYPLFTDNTSPNSNWWDGSDSSVRVKVLTAVGSSTSVQFGKLPPNSIILASPNGGEVMYRDSTFTITWEANIIGNVQIDLFKGGQKYSTIAENAENTGSFKWDIPASMVGGKDFTILISSIVNPLPVKDTSDGVFSITDSTFPEGDVMPYGWKTPEDANVGWQVTKSMVYEGSYSISSKPLGDGKTAAVAYSSNFKAGTLSFYMKVSSEVGYDYASFYIDGVRQSLPGATSKKGITGRTSWGFASYPISAGNHTFKWVYTKDDSYAGGKDRAWVDGVLLPSTTQEIAVNNQNGLQLISGNALTKFSPQQIKSASKPVTFTVKNNGNADLHGMNVLIKGDDSKSFVVGPLGKSVLKKGQSTSFNVKFAPDKTGFKEAKIQILSNDDNESPFVLNVQGIALGIPSISVSQPVDHKLKDGKSLINFGYATVGKTGKTRTFTVRNTGSAMVKGLVVTKSGPAKSNFDIRAIGSSNLAPGESTTFKVTFMPDKPNERLASLHIKFAYKKAGSFDVDLTGTGAPKNGTKSAIASASTDGPAKLLDAVFGAPADDAAGVTTTDIINGQKYLTLTVAKPTVADGLTRTVEVSPNLVDWFSGSKHTTIVTDNEDFQKVRDNTPVTPGVKRFIRLKKTQP